MYSCQPAIFSLVMSIARDLQLSTLSNYFQCKYHINECPFVQPDNPLCDTKGYFLENISFCGSSFDLSRMDNTRAQPESLKYTMCSTLYSLFYVAQTFLNDQVNDVFISLIFFHLQRLLPFRICWSDVTEKVASTL